jgi:hypothetical protein
VKSTLLPAAVLLFGVVPWFADVIPSAYDEKAPADRAAVQARLESLGAPAAEERVARLSAEELSFFARQPERVQAAGGLYWYEFLLGAGVLVLMAIIYFAVIDED